MTTIPMIWNIICKDYVFIIDEGYHKDPAKLTPDKILALLRALDLLVREPQLSRTMFFSHTDVLRTAYRVLRMLQQGTREVRLHLSGLLSDRGGHWEEPMLQSLNTKYGCSCDIGIKST